MPETKSGRGAVPKELLGPEPKLPEEYKKALVAKYGAETTINLTKVQLLFPAHVIYAGAVSGKRYDFKEPGSVLEVDSRDVPAMLAYRIGTTGCCGGSDPSGNTVFQLL